ncbi:transcriptional regulator PpsR [Aurantiacibacter sediminis]|uniref:Transcriptional regulator PpsR n=1 Tax=Aurantiacibacter sediminis TaxID=2793064 RepID=A0ABS0N1Y5_9SPHN|nr:transcriptional regulator PpsR [Aurantiacibacter sediminis]MBH5321975.1 transcriptional regulator PpsR [Aurantiacibacter sediminis]
MLTRKNSIEGKLHYGDFAGIFDDVDPDAAAKLSLIAGDICLVLDLSGRIVGGSADPKQFPELESWIGQDWQDTITVESRPKVMELMGGAREGKAQSWRQINHAAAGADIPVRYAIVTIEGCDRCLALGRDMREEAALQQRFLQAQQALERDYMRLRQAENRYRNLFEHMAEAVLMVEADTYRIREANPAAHKAFDAKPGSLSGGKLPGLFARSSRDALVAYLGSVVATASVAPLTLPTADGEAELTMRATSFRQRGKQFLLVRMNTGKNLDGDVAAPLLDVVRHMPDAFVLTDQHWNIVLANSEFADLIGAASVEQLIGQAVSEYVGRPGIDIDLIRGQLAKHAVARNVSTVVGATDAHGGEPVELSAVQTGDNEPFFGLVIRPVGRRMRDLPRADTESPRSVEQLTEMVGRMSLKEIVRETSDLIERLCIEEALKHTSNNRASAAEILGLSRQSLYSKLHRHGLGNFVAEED